MSPLTSGPCSSETAQEPASCGTCADTAAVAAPCRSTGSLGGSARLAQQQHISPFDVLAQQTCSRADALDEEALGSEDEAEGEGKGEQEVAALPWRENPLFTTGPFILTQEMMERLAYNGIATNIVTYMKNELMLSSSAAATQTQIWSGTCYLTPLLGAFLADAYFGRFKVIVAFSCIYLVGLIGLSLQSGLPGLKPEAGVGASSGSMVLFWLGMYLVALGEGGIKPCVTPFGADQFDDTDPRQARFIPKFFSYCYAAINFGTLLTLSVVVNVQTGVSWAAGFLIITGAFAIAIGVFILGQLLGRYKHWPPAGSPFVRVFRTLVGAVAHRRAVVPAETEGLHEMEGGMMSAVPGQIKLPRTHGMKFLEKAAVPIKPPGEKDRWLVTLTEVEEVKCLARLAPVALTLIMYYAIYGQTCTMFILQGQGMDTQLGSLTLAPATVGVLDCAAVIIGVFVYEMIVVPAFERRGRPISTLQRIGAGYVFAMLCCVAAAVVDIFRQRVVDSHGLQDLDPTIQGNPTVPISVWWQTPQYVFEGLSEMLAVAGSLELFYSQAPDAMRSTCAAVQVLCMALGSYVSAALVSIVQAISTANSGPGWVADNVNQATLDYFFWLLLVLMLLNFLAYLWVASCFRYRKLPQATVGVEAVAAVPDGGGVALSRSFVQGISQDFQCGKVRIESLHQALSGVGSRQLSTVSCRMLRRTWQESSRSMQPALSGSTTAGLAAAAGKSSVPAVADTSQAAVAAKSE